MENKNTIKLNKKQQQLLNNFNQSYNTKLSDIYKTYSGEKARADFLIRQEMEQMHGYRYRIIGGNCNFFSCGYLYIDEQNKIHLVYHTYANKYDFIVDIAE